LKSLIFALGIPNVGEHLSQVLVNQFGSINAIATKTEEELTAIKEIGPIVAKAIFDYFHEQKNLEFIEKLRKGGVNIPEVEIDYSEQSLNGKIFVLTGTLETLTRNEAKVKLQSMGAKVTLSISKNTDFVIVGQNPGSKALKAEELGIAIKNESWLKRLLESNGKTIGNS
ncbi:MAG: NAD-dependent DNA ligase LigA, partial [candidate division Zixibacteria bacterium]|nr:NAD-dependent DNA ligase LigA [candidate division Zixibacteria bacterium]